MQADPDAGERQEVRPAVEHGEPSASPLPQLAWLSDSDVSAEPRSATDRPAASPMHLPAIGPADPGEQGAAGEKSSSTAPADLPSTPIKRHRPVPGSIDAATVPPAPDDPAQKEALPAQASGNEPEPPAFDGRLPSGHRGTGAQVALDAEVPVREVAPHASAVQEVRPGSASAVATEAGTRGGGAQAPDAGKTASAAGLAIEMPPKGAPAKSREAGHDAPGVRRASAQAVRDGPSDAPRSETLARDGTAARHQMVEQVAPAAPQTQEHASEAPRPQAPLLHGLDTPASESIRPLRSFDAGASPLQPAGGASDVGRFERPALHQTTEQVALHVSRAFGEGRTEIRIHLQPPDLGQVDIRLEFQDLRLSATVSADRPETLELLQRDARGLTRAFREAGVQVADSGLSFTQGGQGDSSGAEAHDRQTIGTVRGPADQDDAAAPVRSALPYGGYLALGEGRVDVLV